MFGVPTHSSQYGLKCCPAKGLYQLDKRQLKTLINKTIRKKRKNFALFWAQNLLKLTF